MAGTKTISTTLQKIFEMLAEFSANLKMDNPVVLAILSRRLSELMEKADESKIRYIKPIIAKMQELVIRCGQGEVQKKDALVSLQGFATSLSNYVDVENIRQANRKRAKIKNGIFQALELVVNAIR